VLTIGSQFGPYEIVAMIGAGGMGEVYRARDGRLQRDVALKILPEVFAADPERLARFGREAQVLASLNHPHIAAIHGLEESGASSGSLHAMRALVLELVEGETLADRLRRGPLPIDEALAAATQIAEALQFAHERGVVHRDLKPANIKITPDGVVKVLDFGLAKLAQRPQASEPVHPRAADLTMSPTITSPAAVTGVGVLLGTAAYMAPEQAKGREADKRSDIWAFGCVLYEMVTGRRTFDGEDVGETLASVIKADVDWGAIPPGLPRATRTVIERCLVKDPRKRLADMSVAHFLLTEPMPIAEADSAHDRARGSQIRRAAVVVATVLLASGITGVTVWRYKPEPARPITQFSIAGPEGREFTNGQPIAISPDGSQIAFAANLQLYVRALSDAEVKPISGTLIPSAAVRYPIFSPDGRWIAFYAQSDGTVKTVPIDGGAPVNVCEVPTPIGLSWDGDWILFGRQGGISRVAARGGTPEAIVKTPGELAAMPRMLPGGRTVLFTLARGTGPDMWDTADIVVEDLSSHERKTLIHGGTDGRYVPTGHLLYIVAGIVRAVPFDLKRLEVTGAAVPVIVGVQRVSSRVSATVASGAGHFSVSNTGTLVYVPGPTSVGFQRSLALVDRNGIAKPLPLTPAAYEVPRASPDGKRITYMIDEGKESDVWWYDLAGQTQPRRLTFGGRNYAPIWSPDGERIAFTSDRGGDLAIWWQRVDGGAAERLTKPADKNTYHVADSFSPDGRFLSFTASQSRPPREIWILSLDDKKASVFPTATKDVSHSAFSPDGRWLAYQSGNPATAGVLVEPFPPGGTINMNQVAARSGATPHHPFWSRDGKELFYIPGPNAFAAVAVATRPQFSVGNVVELKRGSFIESGPEALRGMDALPDGRFVVIVDAAAGDATAQRLNVVLNWFEELKRLAPIK